MKIKKGEQRNRKTRTKSKLKIIPLGGLHEIGKNMTVLEYRNDIIIIDCGLSFPNDEMYGIDTVIPDFSYLKENSGKIRGLVITHGHEDHIGGVPYLLKELNIPIYGTKLPLGLIRNKLDEHGLSARMHAIQPGSKIRLGTFLVEAIRTTHSIADSICLSIDTPAGRVFHTGDFKVDYTPVDGEPIDFLRLAELGSKGITLMMCDSTNAGRPGYTESEKMVGKALANIFADSRSRIIVATFSSNVHRIQKIIHNAEKFKRKVAVSGRSMNNVINLATELGYLKIPKGMMVDINETKNIPDKNLLIITTGSQGEPMSALSRMAEGEHKAIKIKKGDVVILSSTPVPGNEKTVSNVVNKLFEKGAEVFYSDISDIHVSGHACREELKLVHTLLKPKFFMPVHGEYRHLKMHADLAKDLGRSEEDMFILKNGDMLEFDWKSAVKHEAAVQAGDVLVDGLGVGDVGNIVLKDRRLLSESGLIIVVAAIDRSARQIVSGPDIISRGFVYVKENESLIEEAENLAQEILEKSLKGKRFDWNTSKNALREALRKYIYQKTERRPVILPVFLEV